MFSKRATTKFTASYWVQLECLWKELLHVDAVVIGAGAGLSTSAGFTYSGERFETNFLDFIAVYHYRDMYTAGFYPYSSPEEYWAYWSRHIDINRYSCTVGKPYDDLRKLVQNKDYFALTTNVDHCFQRAGFDKMRLFYMQGDYGLWQCVDGCDAKTYDNEAAVQEMIKEQRNLCIPTELIPRCPLCGKPMTMNLRCDNKFVEDEGWHLAASRYDAFLQRQSGRRVLYLELGVGYNTPSIIKHSFWRMTSQNPNATYACVNIGEAIVPKEITKRSICMNGDIGKIFSDLL